MKNGAVRLLQRDRHRQAFARRLHALPKRVIGKHSRPEKWIQHRCQFRRHQR